MGREIRRELGIVRERGIKRWRKIKIVDGDGKPELGRGMGRERERGTERKEKEKDEERVVPHQRRRKMIVG